ASPKTNTTTKVTNTTNKASAKTNTTTKVTNTTNKASPKTNTTTKKTTATKTTKSATVKKNQYKQQYLHAQKISKRRFLASKGTRSDNLKGIKDISKVISSCIASNTTYKYDTRWYLTEQNKMGPFGWFDGKYTIPGWKTMEMSYESFDFDFFDAEKLSNGTYILTFEYFNLLIETLNNILPVIAQRIAFMDMNNNINIHDKNSSVEIKQIDNESIINIDEAPTTFNDNRQNAYLKYRTNYELVPAQEIYCT
ncbi:hypothetical protein FG379_001881, partial [Cryptosporidium bovis]|uniref:uncharacterized protein n=1 Tax=Cryptosporidium bovis TaxID=310047 RepID=UPI00351A2D24